MVVGYTVNYYLMSISVMLIYYLVLTELNIKYKEYGVIEVLEGSIEYALLMQNH